MLYKLKKGTDSLYCKGLFFFSKDTYKEEQIPDKAISKYFEPIGERIPPDTKLVDDADGDNPDNKDLENQEPAGTLGFEEEDPQISYTKSGLTNLLKAQQEEILVSLGLNPSDYRNEGERVDAILAAKAGE